MLHHGGAIKELETEFSQHRMEAKQRDAQIIELKLIAKETTAVLNSMKDNLSLLREDIRLMKK